MGGKVVNKIITRNWKFGLNILSTSLHLEEGTVGDMKDC